MAVFRFSFLLFAACAASVLSSCESVMPEADIRVPDKDVSRILRDVTQRLQEQLNSVDAHTRHSANELTPWNLKQDSAPDVMARLNSLNRNIKDCGVVDLKGRIRHSNNSVLRNNFNFEDNLRKIMKERAPVMSRAVRTDSSTSHVVIEYPVFSEKGKISSSIYSLINPSETIRSVVEPLVRGVPVNVWVMQPDGFILYDRSRDESGLNIFKSDAHRPYAGLMSLAAEVAEKRKGSGSYLYNSKGSGGSMAKGAKWNTVFLHGTEWRVVVNMEDSSD